VSIISSAHCAESRLKCSSEEHRYAKSDLCEVERPQTSKDRFLRSRGKPAALGENDLGLSIVHKWRIFEGGSLFLIESSGLKLEENQGDKEKGEKKPIDSFSSRSRLKLIKKLATINQAVAGNPAFLTLTYPQEWPRDGRIVKKHTELLRKSLLYKWPNSWGVWRLEYQKRGAPHLHMFVWDGIKIDDDSKKWLSKTWYRIVGSNDEKHLLAGTKLERIRSWRGVMYYASKYMAKECSIPEEVYNPGRFWACYGERRWKVSTVEGFITRLEWLKLRRIMRRWLKNKTKWKGPKGSPKLGSSFFMNEETASKLLFFLKSDS